MGAKKNYFRRRSHDTFRTVTGIAGGIMAGDINATGSLNCFID